MLLLSVLPRPGRAPLGVCLAAAGLFLSCLNACAPTRSAMPALTPSVANVAAPPANQTSGARPTRHPAPATAAAQPPPAPVPPGVEDRDLPWATDTGAPPNFESEPYSLTDISELVGQPESPVLTALEVALEQIGAPYRRGGTSPRGFDCSGLVRFAFGQAGLELPHGAAAQYRLVHKVGRQDLEPGDLVFFKVRGRHIDHVGIYLEGSDFVHAPSPGKSVSIASLEEPYWQRSFVGAGRLL